MADIVLFHSVLGPRAGVTDAADRLRAAGHTVHTPDLYRGEARFDEYDPAMAYQDSIGFRELLRRAETDVAHLPSRLVYMGFSAGGTPATWLAATRPGALACILLHDALPLRFMEIDTWPATVPVQVHFMRDDPFREQEAIDGMATDVRAAGAPFELFEYDGAGHLFTDPSLPAEYDRAATETLWGRVLALLGGLREEGNAPSSK
ncbi:MAG TPA: dienelactone hydrolase family protein [Chloroflexota bacterium]|nr:dienelactone hydrolase family protein [Chloroflexota bacterium]